MSGNFCLFRFRTKTFEICAASSFWVIMSNLTKQDIGILKEVYNGALLLSQGDGKIYPFEARLDSIDIPVKLVDHLVIENLIYVARSWGDWLRYELTPKGRSLIENANS